MSEATDQMRGLLDQLDAVQAEVTALNGAHGSVVEFSYLQSLLNDLTSSVVALNDALHVPDEQPIDVPGTVPAPPTTEGTPNG
jgi:hypothetical protein